MAAMVLSPLKPFFTIFKSFYYLKNVIVALGAESDLLLLSIVEVYYCSRGSTICSRILLFGKVLLLSGKVLLLLGKVLLLFGSM